MNIFRIVAFVVLVTAFSSCKKYLDKKPELGIFVPNTVEDFQALLDNNSVINQQMGNSLIEIISDNYYQKSKDLRNFPADDQANYLWKSDAQMLDNWRLPYESPIYYSNLVLDRLKIAQEKEHLVEFQKIKGAALFVRAFAFYQLAQVYCKPYSPNTENELGIVLRSTVSVESKSSRSTIKETYDKITSELKESARLLPITVETTMRPSKMAAYALLSRVYLSMSKYAEAEEYADLALNIKDVLLDYNTLLPASNPKLPTFDKNPEVIFFNILRSSAIVTGSAARVDSSLYTSYKENDTRKKVFFVANTGEHIGTYRFRGSYHSVGTGQMVFIGLTTSELYLIKAECLIRRARSTEAMDWLNRLVKNRYSIGYEIADPQNLVVAKQLIMQERKKELIYRGTRWSDIRRLNLEGENLKLRRIVDGAEYSLMPNDLRSVLLIPDGEISRSGISQNLR